MPPIGACSKPRASASAMKPSHSSGDRRFVTVKMRRSSAWAVRWAGRSASIGAAHAGTLRRGGPDPEGRDRAGPGRTGQRGGQEGRASPNIEGSQRWHRSPGRAAARSPRRIQPRAPAAGAARARPDAGAGRSVDRRRCADLPPLRVGRRQRPAARLLGPEPVPPAHPRAARRRARPRRGRPARRRGGGGARRRSRGAGGAAEAPAGAAEAPSGAAEAQARAIAPAAANGAARRGARCTRTRSSGRGTSSGAGRSSIGSPRGPAPRRPPPA